MENAKGAYTPRAAPDRPVAACELYLRGGQGLVPTDVVQDGDREGHRLGALGEEVARVLLGGLEDQALVAQAAVGHADETGAGRHRDSEGVLA